MLLWAQSNISSSLAGHSSTWPSSLAEDPKLFPATLHGALNFKNGERCGTHLGTCFQGYRIDNATDYDNSWSAGGGWVGPPLDECCLAQQVRGQAVDGGWMSVTESARMSMEDWGRTLNNLCMDHLFEAAPQRPDRRSVDWNGGSDIASVMRLGVASAADATACGGACPSSRPFCSDGQCVVPTCVLLQLECNANTLLGLRTRMHCPQTCGCDRPQSPLALSVPELGCPATCVESPSFSVAINALPCIDSPLSGNFATFIDNFHSGSRSWPSAFISWVDALVPSIREYGCHAVAGVFGPAGSLFIAAQLCFGGLYPIKPMAYYCPVACQCSSLNLWPDSVGTMARRVCPLSCNASSPAPPPS
jgi:hypothetical protein